jgi:inorganic triphosphatase YgiF
MGDVEIELKFQLPAVQRAALLRALATASATRVHLQAVYADTADERLAAAGFALRLRKEGRRWVQTLKGRGDGLMQRLEHEVALPAQRGTPRLDPARHAGTPAGDALARLLADGAALAPRYRTDIWRTLRRVRRGGAWVEIAFDEGFIIAGDQRLAVCEVEFELLSGPPDALLALAQTWVGRHRLWLDVRTKSERGHRLALGLTQVPAVKTAAGRGARARVQTALAQLLPNAAELADGQGSKAHLRQLQRALRRLRSTFAGGDEALAATAFDTALRSAADPAVVLREPRFTSWVLQLLRRSAA